MPDTLIELTCTAEWIAHVAHSRHEAEAYALEANRWCAGGKQPCPFDEYIPESSFAVEFEATQTQHGRWVVYVDCSWALSEHASVQEALEAADEYYCADGLCESALEILVFGQEYQPSEDLRPLALLEVGLVIYEGTPDGLTSYRVSGVKGRLSVEEEFVSTHDLQEPE
jgi:hypothetical protein